MTDPSEPTYPLPNPDQVEAPPVPGSTYWAFAPSDLEAALAGWVPDAEEASSRIQRQVVREFLYSAALFRAGLRMETCKQGNPVVDAYGD